MKMEILVGNFDVRNKLTCWLTQRSNLTIGRPSLNLITKKVERYLFI